MTRMQVYIPDDMYAELKYAARVQDVPMSKIVRKGLNKVLVSREKKKKRFGESFIGAGGKIGDKNLSSKIDYYLYGGGSKWAK